MRLIKYLCFIAFAATVIVVNDSCKKSSDTQQTYSADKNRLKTVIDSLTNIYNASSEGTKPGNYAVGSRTNLDSAIVVANEVYNSNAFTQQQVNNTVYNLLQAGIVFQNNLIQEVAATNLIAFWHFDGNAKDSSGNGHDGILKTNYVGAAGAAVDGGTLPQLTTDRFGNANMAYHFSKGATVEVPYSSAFVPQNFTILAWIKMDSNVNCANYFIALNRWNGFKFNIQCSNLLLFTLHTSDGNYYDRDDGTGSIKPGQWVHAAISYSSGLEKFYVNGSLIKTYTDVIGTLATPSPSVNLTIGNELPESDYNLTNTNDPNYFWGADGFWGSIDEVRFYNTQLTDAQILSIYTIESTP
ncbi:MAG: LamG domain-containing protein [Chitinophagaceae bacterium]|jgi:hypothetical protein|nr:LamG domain-containing protein [Chitinophagaceae bacterium]